MEYRVVVRNRGGRIIYKTTVLAWGNMEAKDKGIREYWVYYPKTATIDEMRLRTSAYKPNDGWF